MAYNINALTGKISYVTPAEISQIWETTPPSAGLDGLFHFPTILLIGQTTNLLPLKLALIDHKAGSDCAYQGKDDSKHEKN